MAQTSSGGAPGDLESKDLDGVLNLLKPPGMTSHDVVDVVRRMGGIRRAGHTGTLDPGAAGVLPIVVGRATRLAEYLTGMGKRYLAEATLGISTSTGDSTGVVTSEKDGGGITAHDVEAALGQFHGAIAQEVPALSAKKFAGVRSYDIVRAGGVPEKRLANVIVSRIDLVGFIPGRLAVARLDICCSAGTYIRSVCSQLGVVLGCGAYMSFLLRTSSGRFNLSETLTIEDLQAAFESGAAGDLALDMSRALDFMPGAILSEPAVHNLLNGRAPLKEDVVRWLDPEPCDWASGWANAGSSRGTVRLLSTDGHLIGVGQTAGDSDIKGNIKIRKVLV